MDKDALENLVLTFRYRPVRANERKWSSRRVRGAVEVEEPGGEVLIRGNMRQQAEIGALRANSVRQPRREGGQLQLRRLVPSACEKDKQPKEARRLLEEMHPQTTAVRHGRTTQPCTGRKRPSGR